MNTSWIWKSIALALMLSGITAVRMAAADAEVETDPNKDVAPAVDVQSQDLVRIGEDLLIRKNEIGRNAVVVFGSATVDGQVDRDLVVVGGDVTLNGTAHHRVVVVLGSLHLGPKAVIERELTVVGGAIKSDPGAQVLGRTFHFAMGTQWLGFGWLKDWLFKGLFWARPFPPQVFWLWVVSLIIFLFYLVLSLMFPRPIVACVDVLENKPLVAFFSGMLVFLVTGPIILLLAVSVAGLFVIPFLICGLAVAFIFGKVAVYQFAGRQISHQSRLVALENPAFALVIGMSLFCLLYMIPVVGFLVWGFVAALGMGAAFAAISRAFKRDSIKRDSAKRDVGQVSGDPTTVSVTGDPPIGTAPTTEPSSASVSDLSLLPRAGFWIRLWATVIDLLLLGFLMIFLHFWPIIWVLYHLGMWAWKGTTIGGIVMGLKIIRLDGRKLDIAVVLVRCLAAFLSAIPLFVGFFWVGWDRESQAWHDRIAGTVIVKVPKGFSLI